MMAHDEVFTVVVVGLAVLIFSLILLGLGSWYGGNWEAVAQGIVAFMGIVVAFYIGALALIKFVK